VVASLFQSVNRPTTLAKRAGLSKQAMNQLLKGLGSLGYVARSDAPDESRARINRFIKRGRVAYAKIIDLLPDVEREWTSKLGPKDFAQLKALSFESGKSVDPLANIYLS
jgi:DNA-binding MarR family transcriptional regulator